TIRYQTAADGDVWINSFSVNSSTIDYTVGYLEYETEYNFEIRSENDSIYGDWSEPISVTTGPEGLYHINTCDDLQNMNIDVWGQYVLDGNINCSGTSSWNDGAGFEPVGPDGFPGSL